MMKEQILTLTLEEVKKHSGKYVVDGTEGDQWPSYMYLKKNWIGEQPPRKVTLRIETSE